MIYCILPRFALSSPPVVSVVCRMSCCVLSVVGGPLVLVNVDVDTRSLPRSVCASSRERTTCTVDETLVTTKVTTVTVTLTVPLTVTAIFEKKGLGGRKRKDLRIRIKRNLRND